MTHGTNPEDRSPRTPSRTVITVALTPTFKLVFLSVLAITVIAIIISCPLAIMDRQADAMHQQAEGMKELLATCLTTWKLGFGAMLGLLGGKAMS